MHYSGTLRISLVLLVTLVLAGIYYLYSNRQVKMQPDRDLQWRDFKKVSRINQNPRINAVCIITSDVKILQVKELKDHKKIEVRVNLQLDENRTQVSTAFLGRANSELKKHVLNHENGHVKIAKIVANEIVNTVKAYNFDPENYPAQLDSIVRNKYKRWNELDREYDRETTNPRNLEKQKEWDGFFKNTLNQF